LECIVFKFIRSVGAASVLTSLAVALSACGGGSSGSGGATGATGATGSTPSTAESSTSGTITGFGSVIVEGVKYEDSGATVKVESDATSPTTSTLTALRLGQQVEVKTSTNGVATSINVVSEVLGRITSLATDGFVVAGQTVKVSTDPSAPTVFEGVSGLSGLATQDLVEVHGARNAANDIVATRVERKDASGQAIVRVQGSIAGLDAAARTFSLAGLQVNYASALRVLPSGVTLANGQRVAVWSDTAATSTTLTAKSVVVKTHAPQQNDVLRIAGLVRELNYSAKTFKLDTFDVDASNAVFQRGTINDLANGRRASVKGTFSNGKLVASEVRYRFNQGDALVQLTGAITDFVSASSFKVRGVPVDASASAIVFTNGDVNSLANGVAVEIKGQSVDNAVLPTSIEFKTTSEGGVVPLAGTVRNYNSAAGTFDLYNLAVRLSPSTTFLNSDGTTGQRADLANGSRVQLQGALAGGVFTATQVRYRNGPTLVVNQVGGSAYDVDATAGRFKLNGTVVQTNGSTVITGELGNVTNGASVEVTGTVTNGVLVAATITVNKP
jgi:hypothetical protein